MITPMFALIGLALLAPAGWLCAHLWQQRPRIMRIVVVIDGDTFDAADRRGRRFRLRLRHVDCPEMQQRDGPAVRNWVRQRIQGRWVQVRLRGRDRYRRHLADVHADRENLAALLIRRGMGHCTGGAWWLRGLEWGARLSRRGVHRHVLGVRPWRHWSRRSFMGRWLARRRAR